MAYSKKPDTKSIALVITFTALYVVLGFVKISPIIGLSGQAITAAAIIAPVIGIIFGPYISTVSTFLGGAIGFFFGSFSLLSFSSGIAAAFCGGMAYKKKQIVSIGFYLLLLLCLAFYPVIGPVWIYPLVLWFQIVGFIILASPLQSFAIRHLDSNNNPKLFLAFFTISLTSTLAGQIAGSLTLEMLQPPDLGYWTGTWIATAFLYPIERIIIALSAALVGTSLFKILKSTNFMPFLNSSNRSEEHS